MPLAADIFYRVYSKGSSNRPPLVLIHGAGGSHLYWPAQLRRLPGGPVYALDLPGHGRSGGEGCASIPAYAERVRAWLRAAGVGPAVLCGHSLGSAVVLELALRWPEEAVGLILLGAAARLRVNPELLEALANPGSFIAAVRQLTAWSYGPGTPPELLALAARRMAETGPEVLLGDFQACNAFDISAQLGEIRQPALVLCGEHDRMVPLRQSQALAAGLPNAHLEMIPAAGHMLMLEQPDAVQEALRAALREFSAS